MIRRLYRALLTVIAAGVRHAPISLARTVFAAAVDRLPTAELEASILAALERRTGELPPDERLRLLFRLDERLYTQQGLAAIAYDDGLHAKHRLTRYHDFFTARISAEQHVLDIGCGVGALAHAIAEATGATVTGIDINAQNIERARARFAHPRVTYVTGDALDYLPPEPVDVVVLSNVLEHIPPDRAAFLRRVTATVRPARYLIRVPLFERDWRVPLKRELGVEWRLDPTHHTEYTLESFAEEMAAAGLVPVHQEVRWGEIWAELRAADA